jgi:hypothetical protein
VPNGKWLKRFAQFTICGEGELIKKLAHSKSAAAGGGKKIRFTLPFSVCEDKAFQTTRSAVIPINRLQ